MQKCVLRRDAHFTSIDLNVFDILLIDLVAFIRQSDAATVVETLNVRAKEAVCDAALVGGNGSAGNIFTGSANRS